jgi:alkylation response protein AidB-like acyl-CoA dehydrogenase
MDFNFTSEQVMLRDSVSRYLGDRYDFPQRQAAIHSPAGWRPEIWKGLAEDLGILGAPFSEAHGGLGGGPVETMIVMEELGRALVVEPFLETVVIGGGVLRRWDTPRAAELIGAIIAGEVRLALAYLEPDARYELSDVGVSARKNGDSYVLDGLKDAVVAAPFATHLIVTARTSGERRDPAGVSLFLVEAAAAGLNLHDYPTVDGSRAADITFTAAPGELIGDEGQGLELLEPALDEALAALCAEAVGVMRRMQADTLDYAKQRKQFGAPIAANQVLQHRMVDMFLELEQAVSMTYMATLKLDRPDAQRIRAVSAAKARVGRAAKFVGQNAIQIHGGMGMTDELAVSHYFKRATMIDNQFGSADYHMARFEAAAAAAGDDV